MAVVENVPQVTPNSQWSSWSSCKPASVYRYRYKRCTGLGKRAKCESEKQRCPGASPAMVVDIPAGVTVAPSSFVVEPNTTTTLGTRTSRARLLTGDGGTFGKKTKARKMDAAAMRTFRSNFKSMRDSPLETSASPCKAVIDHRGRKQCPHGMRMFDGRLLSCANPVDC